MRIFEVDLNEATLSPKNFRDNPTRLQAFADRYEAGQKFVAKGQPEDNPTIELEIEPEKLNMMRNGQVPLSLKDTEGRTVSWSSLQKTSEFGGGSRISGMNWEKQAMSDINAQLAEMKGDKKEIPLVIGDKEVMVARFEDTPGTPKSDFHAVNAAGQEVAWISHKKGSSAKDFGQWGGCSESELASVYQKWPELQEEINSFVTAVKSAIGGNTYPGGFTMGRKIESGRLKGIAVYGRDYVPHKKGGADRGRQNVDLVIQGNPYFDGNRLLADGNVHINGERVEGEFEPVLIVRKASDRSNFGLNKARFAFYPEAGRPIQHWV